MLPAVEATALPLAAWVNIWKIAALLTFAWTRSMYVIVSRPPSPLVLTVIQIIRYNEDMHNSAYLKTWVGALVPQSSYESAGVPRGDGWGSIRNVLFSNFNVQGASAGPSISQDSGDNGSYAGTSKMSISNVAFVNFTGWVDTEKSVVSTVSCSEVHPCYNIEYDNVVLYPGKNATTAGTGSCKYTADGGVHGLSGC